MNCLILANGSPPSAQLVRALALSNDLVLAADGAAQQAIALGVTPDIVCGDFDSVEMAAARAAFPTADFVPTPDQSYADLEKAILLARARGAGEITLTGTAGGRIDHTLANHVLLLRYGGEFPVKIVEDNTEVHAVFGACRLETQSGDTLSLIAFGPGVRVSITGTQWELHDAPLSPGTGGVSNVATGGIVEIHVHGGGPILACRLTPDSGIANPLR